MIRHGAQARFPLDDFWALSTESPSRPDLAHRLAEAGLDLRQAPQGFWAVRLKPAPLPVVRMRGRTMRRTK
jgi:hypothetical protein